MEQNTSGREGTLRAEKSSEETKEQENRQLKEKTDKKMIIGWIILIGVMAAIGGGFWSTAADQAEHETGRGQTGRTGGDSYVY